MYKEETVTKEKNIILKKIENIAIDDFINGMSFSIITIIVGIVLLGFIRLSLEHRGFIVPTVLAGAGAYYIYSQLLSSD